MTDLGIELEYPVRAGERLRHRADPSENIYREFYDHPDAPPVHRAVTTWDGTVGLEIVSDVIDVWDGQAWMDQNTAMVEEHTGAVYEPCGLLYGGSSAGLHLHISPLTSEQAEQLYRLSKDPFVRALVCTSVVESDAPHYSLFRHNYCQFREIDQDRYEAVNYRGDDHYEWRLPEPMLPEDFSRVAEFIDMVADDRFDDAQSYAQECVEAGDTTAMKRIDAIGIDPKPFDGELPEGDVWYRGLDRREPSDRGLPMGIAFQEWRSDASAPVVSYLSVPDGHYIVCESDVHSPLNPYQAMDHNGNTVTLFHGLVIDADTGERCDPEMASAVRQRKADLIAAADEYDDRVRKSDNDRKTLTEALQ